MPKKPTYSDAFVRHAKKLLPESMIKQVHRKARAAAGGHAASRAAQERKKAQSQADTQSETIAKLALQAQSFIPIHDATEALALTALRDVPALIVEGIGQAVRDHRLIPVAKRKNAPRLRTRILKALEGQKPIIDTSSSRQVVYCVALEPDSYDFHSDAMEAAEIEKAAESFMEKSRIIGSMHQKAISAVPVHSYIAPQDLTFPTGAYGPQRVKKGSWVLGIKVKDPQEWAKVCNGEYTGISVGGFGRRKPS